MPRSDEDRLLPVIRQHLQAGLGELAAILFQARQHDLIAFLDVRPAKALIHMSSNNEASNTVMVSGQEEEMVRTSVAALI